MHINPFRRMALAGVALAMTAVIVSPVGRAKEPKLSAEEIVQRNIASIGSPEAQAAVKSLLVGGNATVAVLAGGSGGTSGPFAFLSQGHRWILQVKFNSPDYPQEECAFDGEKDLVAYVAPGKRSRLGQFLQDHSVILSEGLLGGTLSTAWPLLNLHERNPKLSFKGTTKIEGRDLYKLEYHPRRRAGELQISLYFDPQTFRHVRTTYELVIEPGGAPGLIGGPDQAMRMPNARYRLEEDFSDFQTENGLTLPKHWTLTLSYWGRIGTYSEQFDMMVDHVDTQLVVNKNAFEIQ